MVLQIDLPGRIPSKKNSKQWIKRGGRMLLVPSANYRVWHEEMMYRLIKYRLKNKISSAFVSLTFTFPDNIKSDLSNKAESVMDLLVDAGVIPDDNHKVIPTLHLISAGVDKNNAGVKIIIDYYDQDHSATTHEGGKESRGRTA